jgi:CRP/FNR family cyclic AMP-dependent transcriptional regulator
MREWITPEVLAQLRGDPWFAQVTPAFEADLLSRATVRRLQSGEHLFMRGDPPDGMFAVLDGTVRISGVTEAGKEAILSIIEAPAWFGEIALFDQLPRTHNAVVDGNARLLHVPMAEMMDLVAQQPAHWRELGMLMALRVRLAFIGLEDMALLSAEHRLLRRLVWLVQTHTTAQPAQAVWATQDPSLPEPPRVLPLSQAQLGMMLSLSRQTTNQILQSLQDQGVLRVSYGRIEVIHRAKLMALAGVSDTERAVLDHLNPLTPRA